MSDKRLDPCPFCAAAEGDTLIDDGIAKPAIGLIEYSGSWIKEVYYSPCFSVNCENCGANGPIRPQPAEARTAWNQKEEPR